MSWLAHASSNLTFAAQSPRAQADCQQRPVASLTEALILTWPHQLRLQPQPIPKITPKAGTSSPDTWPLVQPRALAVPTGRMSVPMQVSLSKSPCLLLLPAAASYSADLHVWWQPVRLGGLSTRQLSSLPLHYKAHVTSQLPGEFWTPTFDYISQGNRNKGGWPFSGDTRGIKAVEKKNRRRNARKMRGFGFFSLF